MPPDTTKQLRFEKVCSYCGASMEVTADVLSARPRAQHYACPDCGMEHEFTGTGAPGVRLLRHRQDGKTDRYQPTMF
jgi:predicted RNA-binding Zn-ribbon protein involved in translation (DUF1610 family)